MKACLTGAMLVCISASTLAKSADVAIADCADESLAIITHVSHAAGEVIVGPDDSTMRKLRVNVSNICTSAYTQGLAARTSKEIKLTHEQVRPAMRGWIAARMPKDIPKELTDRMTNTLTDAFMGAYAHSPDAD